MISVVVYRDAGAIPFKRIADPGGEATVPQGTVQHSDTDPEVPIYLPGSEQRIVGGVSTDVDAGGERHGQPAVERPRKRRSQADQATAVVFRLRLDDFERRLRPDRSPAVEGMSKARVRGDAPSVPVGPPIVRPVSGAQCETEPGRAGEPKACLYPGAEAVLVAIAPGPAPPRAQSAGHAAACRDRYESPMSEEVERSFQSERS